MSSITGQYASSISSSSEMSPVASTTPLRALTRTYASPERLPKAPVTAPASSVISCAPGVLYKNFTPLSAAFSPMALYRSAKPL